MLLPISQHLVIIELPALFVAQMTAVFGIRNDHVAALIAQRAYVRSTDNPIAIDCQQFLRIVEGTPAMLLRATKRNRTYDMAGLVLVEKAEFTRKFKRNGSVRQDNLAFFVLKFGYKLLLFLGPSLGPELVMEVAG